VWQLPVIFCIENNGYGLSTPTSEQYKCKDLADRGMGYGITSHIVDGNNVLEVYDTINQLCTTVRKEPRPILVEFKTFRMRGHEEASGTKYVPKDLMDHWQEKDPIANYRSFLLSENILTENQDIELQTNIKSEIERDWKQNYLPCTQHFP